MHTDVQMNDVIKPINRFDDGHPAHGQGKVSLPDKTVRCFSIDAAVFILLPKAGYVLHDLSFCVEKSLLFPLLWQ